MSQALFRFANMCQTEYNNITIQLMFTGINIFLAQTHFSSSVARVKISFEQGQNIFGTKAKL
jgi:hypothetical protein